MIPWKTFKFRRKLQLARLVKDQKLTTYDKLVAYLHSLHVAAPSLEEYNKATEKESVKPAQTKKPATKKSTPTKKSSVSKTPDEDPSEVWGSGLEASYADKKSVKAPAKRKPPTKRSTRSTRTTKKKS